MLAHLLSALATIQATGQGLPPRWGWYVILYFFLGGLAAGSYFIATLLAFQGDERDRETIHLGYLLSFPLVLVCAVLLIVDLGVPVRFWHMLIQSEHVPAPMLKPWSPISIGAWVLLIFGAFSFASFVGTLVAEGRVRSAWLTTVEQKVRALPGPFAVGWGIAGTFFGFFMAGYTGVLMTGTSIPLWHNARFTGALFLTSAASTSYALLLFLLVRRGFAHSGAPVRKLVRADRHAILLELGIIAVTLIGLGGVARPIIAGGFGVVFWVGVIGVGLVWPLALHRVKLLRWNDQQRAVAGAVCVLVGGLLLRFVIVMAPQFPRVPLWHL